jgi:hypothetical protein
MKKIFIAFTGLTILFFASCEKEMIKPVGLENPTFSDIQSVLSAASCTSCHKSGGSAFDLSLSNLQSKNLISKPGSSSGLLKKINGGHNSGNITPGNKITITNWVDLGAPAK